jgi:hypothetical protein
MRAASCPDDGHRGATEQSEELALVHSIHRVGECECEWVQRTAFRKSVRDVLKFAASLFWNVKVA